MADDFSNQQPGLTSPGLMAFAITPNDSTDLAKVPRGIYVGVSGDVVVKMLNAAGAVASVTFVGLAAGITHPIRPSRVMSTGTTATGLVAIA